MKWAIVKNLKTGKFSVWPVKRGGALILKPEFFCFGFRRSQFSAVAAALSLQTKEAA